MDEILKQEMRRIAKEESLAAIQNADTVNQFAVSETSYHTHNGTDSQRIPFLNLADAPDSYFDKLGYAAIVNAAEKGLIFSPTLTGAVVNTNGTTNVDVFGTAGAAFPLTITSVYLISKDTTAGNITVLQGANTVCTIAKGTVAGAMVGAASLSNTVYAKGDIFQVDSSSAGNATVFITFIPS